MDWWNIKAEHTPYEWAAQWAMYLACPFGERRADIRSAYMTTHLLASTRSEQLPGDEMLAMWKSLSGYLACEQPQEPEDQRPDLDALALMQEQMKVT